ncbi:MAG: histone deacetylase family protein [Gammaproteobacteria bacterium]|nr:histone deacetylase family protein [Gammaproteobacteria bacterium]
MLSIFSEKHLLHGGLMEPASDHWIPGAESPERANNVLAAIRRVGFGDVVPPDEFDDTHILAVHDPDYVRFLESAWDEWLASGEQGSVARPYAFVTDGMRGAHTENIYGKLGRYAFDIFAPIVAGSWQAIRSAADVAMTGAQHIVHGESSAFAICRPPGHHASADLAGGYCYLNNCAIAAQSMIASGRSKVAILDVDYHHGNGTQSIFYDRDDVLTISLHADPAFEYPYYLGYADERGAGDGLGYNRNYPLARGTRWASYCDALMDALQRIQNYSPDAVVCALGLDTYAMDPTTDFAIQSADYSEMGKLVGSLDAPVLSVLEGGYDIDSIGMNTVNFLAGLRSAKT